MSDAERTAVQNEAAKIDAKLRQLEGAGGVGVGGVGGVPLPMHAPVPVPIQQAPNPYAYGKLPVPPPAYVPVPGAYAYGKLPVPPQAYVPVPGVGHAAPVPGVWPMPMQQPSMVPLPSAVPMQAHPHHHHHHHHPGHVQAHPHHHHHHGHGHHGHAAATAVPVPVGVAKAGAPFTPVGNNKATPGVATPSSGATTAPAPKPFLSGGSDHSPVTSSSTSAGSSTASASASAPIGVSTEMPYGELEAYGREDTAQELTDNSVAESDEMVDQVERAEVAEEKRSVFRALTRLRGVAVTSFDGIARAQTGQIDEYNKAHQWRRTHPLHHLASEEADVVRWAFPEASD